MLHRDVLYSVALQMPYHEVPGVCRTVKQYQQICRNKTFWEQKAQQDLGVSPDDFELLPGDSGYLKYKNYIEQEALRLLPWIRGYLQDNFSIDTLTNNGRLLSRRDRYILENTLIPGSKETHIVYPMTTYGPDEDDITWRFGEEVTPFDILEQIHALFFTEPINEAYLDDALEKLGGIEDFFSDSYYREPPFIRQRNQIRRGSPVYIKDLFFDLTPSSMTITSTGDHVNIRLWIS